MPMDSTSANPKFGHVCMSHEESINRFIPVFPVFKVGRKVIHHPHHSNEIKKLDNGALREARPKVNPEAFNGHIFKGHTIVIQLLLFLLLTTPH